MVNYWKLEVTREKNVHSNNDTCNAWAKYFVTPVNIPQKYFTTLEFNTVFKIFLIQKKIIRSICAAAQDLLFRICKKWAQKTYFRERSSLTLCFLSYQMLYWLKISVSLPSKIRGTLKCAEHLPAQVSSSIITKAKA